VGQLEGIPFAWEMQKEFITSKAGKKSFENFYLKYKEKKEDIRQFYSFSETILPEVFNRFSEKKWSISDEPVIILSVCHLATGEFSSEKNSILLSLDQMSSKKFLKQVVAHELVHYFHYQVLREAGLPREEYTLKKPLYHTLWHEGIAVAGVVFLFPELAKIRHTDERHLKLFEGGFFGNWSRQFIKDAEKHAHLLSLFPMDSTSIFDETEEIQNIEDRWVGGLKTNNRPFGLHYLLGEGLLWYMTTIRKISWHDILSSYGADLEKQVKRNLRILTGTPYFLLTETNPKKAEAMRYYEWKNRGRISHLIVTSETPHAFSIASSTQLEIPPNEAEILEHLGQTLKDTLSIEDPERAYQETKDLLEQGTLVHMIFEEGYSALMIAAERGPKFVQLLLDFGSDASYDVANLIEDLEAKEHLHETAIKRALHRQKNPKNLFRTIEILLEHGCPVHPCDKEMVLVLGYKDIEELFSSNGF
jgi:hypothetical protein